ncbi:MULTISPECIES: LacI family DNA-binding transcriptional regulator [Pseudoalteromonas]|jgi:LacI family transcriptional regulator|uniref:LacI family DNA-binding transcriptional regulator n=1 Tax=Pseudoalteromonas lipolytica TaxID=570156 RepID=A0AAD0WCL3_9GAMM|nr:MULTISPECIES: LacI family DNA-binding transcriptional regulator [Pseudoalteromonas]AXV65410.1 LacI family DNA-binding transcriptional regulator [Pseudoalteromonas donghaensis]EWH07011.1 LacI family transcriptional regulator [Pseudoalteromonas lipolytica SCSIO 04301]MBE0350772.1 LacI family transcriptional regulator [Pseudoalteromonas lipolytica LMEB 39]MCC9662172.1 LacI family transcriptional regulator [Pseudoalteromonas sp. MB41]QLJ06955.1 LacI family DNA-binding transcriptional regulator |tara:strand:+ start:10144 stop:11145 length:1002 start_codon:yes stop_codon:yes gene_type:complete
MATIYQVSELAGVSLSTVSRVLNENDYVSKKTKQKVLDAMKQLGYQPNSIARSLASNCSNSVGVLVSELDGPFFGEMMSAIEAQLRAAGKHVIITPGHSEEDKEKNGLEFLISRNCDAIIAHVEAVTDDYLVELNKGKTPIFLISRYVEQMKENCISLDNVMGGYLATKHLLDLGHRDITYIAGPLFKPDAADRLTGHKKALNEYNIHFDEQSLYVGDFKETGGYNGLKHFFENKKQFTAIVCANDEMASGVMKCAREHNFELPKDLAIIGFDNVHFTSYLYPTLTTIDNPVEQMGKMAANLVLRDIYKQNRADIEHIFSPNLMMRDSTPRSN